jgi:hypothetical protein
VKFADLAFKQNAEETRKPVRTVKIEPGDFADDWRNKPKSAVVVGLRLLSSNDEDTAKEQAYKSAQELGPDADPSAITEKFESTLKSYAVALALCDPNDVKSSHPAFPMAEDNVPEALTSNCITRLFDELERTQIEHSPLFGEIDEDSVRSLVAALSIDDPFDGIPDEEARRIRRYLQFVFDEILALGPEIDPD